MKRNYQNPSAEKWFYGLAENPAGFPFSFVYGGKCYEGFSEEKFDLINCNILKDEKSESREFCFGLKGDVLQVSLLFTFYPAYGISEWTVWFENTGDQDSEILEDVKSTLTFAGKKPVLKGILGDHENQYRAYSTDLTKEEVHFLSDSGRATHVNFPYFNLEYGDGGAMLVIGWAGTWTADFTSKGDVTTYTARSVYNLCSYLKPGEKIRTALFVYAPYAVRDEYYSTNFWRSWFMDCNLPAENAAGKKAEPFSTCCLCYDTGLPNSDGSISERYYTWKPSMEKMIEVGAKVDVRWFDAGWYTAPDGSSPQKDWWGTVGTWELDPVKWPGKTFLESTEFARENGMKTMMWFEPERITDVDSLVKNHGYDPSWAIRLEGSNAISNNIGIPECYEWTVNRICKVLRENKVEIYREDNNSDPARLWKYLDDGEGENRTGITECRFIEGHYRMWDDIIACTLSFGGAGFVDSCASGGGRNDLESMRRGIPILRSDADRTTTALRLSMTTAFNRWIPFCGANTREKVGQLDPTGRSDVYTWRASYLAALNVDSQFVEDAGQDFSVLTFGLNEWKKVNPYILKEFYVLTPWHDEFDRSGFTAYSFWDPEAEKGVCLIFRMEDCEEDTVQISQPFAEKEASYILKNEDTKEEWCVCGEELSELKTVLSEKRSSALIWIEKK